MEISFLIMLAILFGCFWVLGVLRECRKIFNKMQKRSRRYMRDVVSNDK